MCLLHHTADATEKIAGNIAHGLVVGASAENIAEALGRGRFRGSNLGPRCHWEVRLADPAQGARESACILSKQKDLNRLGRGNDALISPIYANEFASQIVNSQVEITRIVDTCRKRNSAVVELLESRFLRPKGASL